MVKCATKIKTNIIYEILILRLGSECTTGANDINNTEPDIKAAEANSINCSSRISTNDSIATGIKADREYPYAHRHSRKVYNLTQARH